MMPDYKAMAKPEPWGCSCGATMASHLRAVDHALSPRCPLRRPKLTRVTKG